jgi:hypothetical protein
MRTAMVLLLVALAGCATTPGPDVVEGPTGSQCLTLASPTQTAAERTWVHAIDPQVTLSWYQLHCMRDTPLGL